MGLWKRMRERLIERNAGQSSDQYDITSTHDTDHVKKVPARVLERIFTFICPHTLDFTYEQSEDADLPDTCMLCDLRDLAHCCSVRKDWYAIASKTLYTSIRIENVHYCIREQTLFEERYKKARKAKGKRTDSPPTKEQYEYSAEMDPTIERVQMLAETLRENPRLAAFVQYFKLPYMVRKRQRADLARIVSVCHNLRYVDLPDEFYSGAEGGDMLRNELMKNCVELRKIKFTHGSEFFFQMLYTSNPWLHLEVLVLESIQMDVMTFRRILSKLQMLNSLTLKGIPDLRNDIFSVAAPVPDFATVRTLVLHNLPDITLQGLATYFSRAENRKALQNLVVDNTGVTVPDLPAILSMAPDLRSLTFILHVASPFTLDPIPSLASRTLELLHFEIKIPRSYLASDLPKPSASYHEYLLRSLKGPHFPALRALYCRDPDMPGLLCSRSPTAWTASVNSLKNHTQMREAAGPHRLEVYTKPAADVDSIALSMRKQHAYDPEAYKPELRFNSAWGALAEKALLMATGKGDYARAAPEDGILRKRNTIVVGGNMEERWRDNRQGNGGKRKSRWVSFVGSRGDLWA